MTRQRFFITMIAAVGMVAVMAPAGLARAAIIIQDDFSTPKNPLSGTAPEDVNLPGANYGDSISTLNNQDVYVDSSERANFKGDQINGIAVSTGAYTITGFSLDLIALSHGSGSAVMYGGFWSTDPGGTRNPTSNFTGFRFTTANIVLAHGGATVETIAHGLTINVLQPYTLSFDIEADGSFSSLSLGGVDLTSAFTADSTGFFSDTATAYVGGGMGGGQNARGAMDNLIVTGVPEPTSLLLLGIGGFMVVRRRRNGSIAREPLAL